MTNGANLMANCKLFEIFSSFRHDISKQADYNTACIFTSNCDVKKHLEFKMAKLN